MDHLMLIADQLYDLGFRGMKPRSLKQKHVDALVKDWLRQDLDRIRRGIQAHIDAPRSDDVQAAFAKWGVQVEAEMD
jgi:hypothetical protein